ncbi:hypothetical protein BRADI_3g39680v3 [Brachypodium distachyon]|uniref:Protein kinase domain-containing protein n=2 Tax=Brachypodium distachyon TaxID=15368 RepID=A0A2K2D287_BRADI|nr:hypothetical protein BRADI_3g39680v3 [Brachypodium distachyon]
MERVARRARAMILAAVAVTALMPLLPPSSGASHGEGCTTTCGNISIPYPFGVEPGCYHEGGFKLTCDHSYDLPRLFLGDGTVQVLDISILNGTVRINSNSVELFRLGTGGANGTWRAGGLGYAGPYFLSEAQNKLLAVGCDVQVILRGENNTLGSSCSPFCLEADGAASIDASSGIGRCQATILKGGASYGIQLHQLGFASSEETYTGVFIMEWDYSFNIAEYIFGYQTVPAVLGWTINDSNCHSNGSSPSCRSNHSFCENYDSHFDFHPSHRGHNCWCSDGYQGNPYIPDGCYDIDECEHPEEHQCYGICTNMPGTFHCRCPGGTYGDSQIKQGCVATKNSCTGLRVGLGVGGIVLLALSAPYIRSKIKSSRENELKQKFFKQNHGLLLQQIVSQKTDFGERMITPLLDLEKATNFFDRTHEAGGGGHGIVYKGLLGIHVVAIKKSKIVVQREIDDFINEVAILSQINHRNVVKLIGCCLETEVPLLVYEFISNGTLDSHLHVEGTTSVSWNDRIRIALEVARAISYLHSAASMPIYHRDIKSSNILLDDNFTAKVSDFGASRYIPIDQTGVSTAVQGTIGYLDPIYYYTGRLTDKSDVFSFGVLLIELLTKKKPCVFRGGDGVGLVSHFVSLLTEGKLNGIIDPQVMEEEDGEVQELATLAAMCTKLKGEDRPTMREVEMKLENLRPTKRHAAPDTASSSSTRDHFRASYMSVEVVSKEASRQYTMEEEVLMSARIRTRNRSTRKPTVSSWKPLQGHYVLM